ncbi:FAD/NAD(P)-binding protein [Psychroserpens algicola]|uniref:FAD/NAD(P)-binding protein n=1 Tax=Psychroserpens algicola TaxID=1719034 RepID=A0ABT0HAL5_9FLAO|nr:FAD/NAD(P)-binding protein [Psychroserpens algicola]MCK8481400.1 FAD/NAD(P)-binding protein [Psychroserpens algicola]
MTTLAIIGIGPRGLHALENLLINLSRANKHIQILAFEPCHEPGAGQVWYTNQSDANWTNISERALKNLEGRQEIHYRDRLIEGFPSYHEWINFAQSDKAPDTFPPRKQLGRYLHERYESLTKSLEHDSFQLINSKVERIEFKQQQLQVLTKDNSYICDDALITIGHQPTELSKQIKEWKAHAKAHQNINTFEDCYPLSQFESIKNQKHLNIGIRGFGLAMIDVMRDLTTNSFGTFRVVDPSTFKTQYISNEAQHLKLIPFSLDGLPMAPKPLNKHIDDWFKPTDEELNYFKTELEAVSRTQIKVSSLDFLTIPISKIAARVFVELKSEAMNHDLNQKQIETLVLKWLDDSETKHHLFQDNSSTYNTIKSYIQMASGLASISLDYCIGQVWRHCQPTLYKSFSHAQLDEAIIEKVIALDEESKRFSYGPPVESMQQILALVDANILSLDYVNDPDIKLNDKGWQLENAQQQTIQIDIMINSVLDAPKLLEVTAPIITNLIHNDLIEPIHSKLGIDTKPNAYVITEENNEDIPIAVLGRLSKGSVIGVDAILECFGPRIKDWAEAYVNQLGS